MKGFDVIDETAPGGGDQGGFEQDGVVSVGATDGPTDRYAVAVGQKRPLPPQFPPVSGVFAGTLPTAGGLVLRPVDRGFAQIQTDYPVIGLDRFGDQPVVTAITEIPLNT